MKCAFRINIATARFFIDFEKKKVLRIHSVKMSGAMYAAVKHRDIATNADQRVSCDHFGFSVHSKRKGMGGGRGGWDRNPSLTVHNNPSRTRTSVITGCFFANLSSTAIDIATDRWFKISNVTLRPYNSSRMNEAPLMRKNAQNS